MNSRRLSLVFVALALTACKKPEEAASAEKPQQTPPPPVTVEDAPIVIQPMPRTLTLTGTVVADRQSEVAANVSGRVIATPIERGRKVQAGETLAIVDSKAAGFSVAATAAQAELALTQVHQAEEDCARAERLYKEGAVAEAEYNRQKTQCKAQLLQATAAKAQAELQAKLAGDTIIRAPFSGAIGERYVNAGEYVQPASKVASIYSFDPVRVTVSVPEPAVGKVKEGQTLELRVASEPDRSFPATVVYLSPALRTTTRDLLVEAKAPNPDGNLRPGMFATVELKVGEEKTPTVPEDALVTEGTVKKIYLVRDGRAFELVVRTSVKEGGRVGIIEPLTEKDRVIRRPPPGLRDGSVVTIGTPKAGEAAKPVEAPKPNPSATGARAPH
jgi:membrane fusion protein (multidrug efflux system)